MREAAFWFSIGSAVALFVALAMLCFAAVPGVDATLRVARAVGTKVDKLAGLEPPKARYVARTADWEGRSKCTNVC